MRLQQFKFHSFVIFAFLIALFCNDALALETNPNDAANKTVNIEKPQLEKPQQKTASSIDRIDLVNKQIAILKDRLIQYQKEHATLEQQLNKNDQDLMGQVSKNLLNKISLDIAVSKSNLDSLNIEVNDCQQTIIWLEKSIQDIENQLNVLNIFGLKAAPSNSINTLDLRKDLNYQKKLLSLEKARIVILRNLQNLAQNILVLKNEHYNQINNLMRSSTLLHLKQQQVKDELDYQEQQNYWLQQLTSFYQQIGKFSPGQRQYAELERRIFMANENANVAYSHSLIARYRDQIEQMKLSILRNTSISLLNEISNAVQTLAKQVSRLDSSINTRAQVLQNHITFLMQKKKVDVQSNEYINKLKLISQEYIELDKSLVHLNSHLAEFRVSLENSLQNELSSRQGLPMFSMKTMLDLGKEILLVPALTFQVAKSLMNNVIKALGSANLNLWIYLITIEAFILIAFNFIRRWLSYVIHKPSNVLDRLNAKGIFINWLQRNLIDIVVISNVLTMLSILNIPYQNSMFILYLAFVWMIFKGMITLARLYLVETLNVSDSRDVRLYKRLYWVLILGWVITTLTVFINLLPLIYELKTVFNRLFLLYLLIISLFMLRSWDVLPNIIVAHIERNHTYLRKSICLIGIFVPVLMLANSLIGLFGYVNLILTISWYESIFLFVMIGHLILRGLLSDGMEELSRLMIQYVNNGWLWTEAVLKPLDKVLRMTLFLIACVVLFLLYGWDQQSPIVERLTRLLHYKLISILNTTITPLHFIELFIVISIFYWTAKWTREFVYRLLLSRTKDMGIRNSIAILSQYTIVIVGIFICLQVLGIDLRALAVVAGMFSLGIGLGLRDLANNFACGFLILLERPLRVGDIVSVSGTDGEVTHIGSRAVTVRTWDSMELVVPNAEIFNKTFTNWTARDNTVRSIVHIKLSREDNPHHIRTIIQDTIAAQPLILKEPVFDVYLREMNDTFFTFELRYFVNIRNIKSRAEVMSAVLMDLWDAFSANGIKTPFPIQEVLLRNSQTTLGNA